MKQAKGFKPHDAAELLNVGMQTLRYWRTHVDPFPHRSYFSGGTLFAYLVIKYFCRTMRVPVGVLEKCSWESIFRLCESTHMKELANQAILVDEKSYTLTVVELKHRLPDFVFHIHRLPLKPLVEEHIDALVNYGSTIR